MQYIIIVVVAQHVLADLQVDLVKYQAACTSKKS